MEPPLVACSVARKVVNLDQRKAAWKATLMVGWWDSQTVVRSDVVKAALWDCRKVGV